MLLVDTGVLVALGNRNDRYHRVCDELLATDPGPLVTTALVIAEAGYMLSRGLGVTAERALIEMITDATLIVKEVTAADWVRTGELLDIYADSNIGVTDASQIAVAERLNIERIATLDRRHFRLVRPKHCTAFTLLPDGIVETTPRPDLKDSPP